MDNYTNTNKQINELKTHKHEHKTHKHTHAHTHTHTHTYIHTQSNNILLGLRIGFDFQFPQGILSFGRIIDFRRTSREFKESNLEICSTTRCITG